MTRLIVASNNPHKIEEIAAIYSEFPLTVLSQRDAGFSGGVDETGTTFSENARLKISPFPDLPDTLYLADDSGLEVQVLGNQPGVYSARYGGPGLTDIQRCERLLQTIADQADRRARFVCVCVLRLPGGRFVEAEGRVNGALRTRLAGEGGFGYDPIFVPEGYTQTFAQLPATTKNELSHRARALATLRPVLGEYLQSRYTF